MGLTSHLIAIERVQQRLRKVTAALDAAHIPYAVVGGNAVASWVGRVDSGATRATRSFDILVRRQDVPQVSAVITGLGFAREDLRDLVLFIDPEGFLVIRVAALVRMMLTSFRPIDQVHIADMLSVGLIDAAIKSSLPPELVQRLSQVESQSAE